MTLLLSFQLNPINDISNYIVQHCGTLSISSSIPIVSTKDNRRPDDCGDETLSAELRTDIRYDCYGLLIFCFEFGAGMQRPLFYAEHPYTRAYICHGL